MSPFPPSVPPNPPQAQPTLPASTPYEAFTSKASLATLIACPILALLPPRKLDLYTFSLAAGFVVAANHQTRLRTGKGILLNMYSRKQEREERREREKVWREWEEDQSGSRGLAKKIWMGGEKAGWKEKRMREEREIAEQGKGIGDVIIDQVKEVWGVPKESDEDDQEDEKKT